MTTAYNRNDMRASCEYFEQEFGMSSEVFYEAHTRDDKAVAHIPGFERHLWASFYRDYCRMDNPSDAFCEIDAEEFAKAKSDPKHKDFAALAKAHLKRLRNEGRISE